eukprot:8306965-Heterocapsa_arctica.AAC.1
MDVMGDGTVQISALSDADCEGVRPNTHFFRTFPDGNFPESNPLGLIPADENKTENVAATL